MKKFIGFTRNLFEGGKKVTEEDVGELIKSLSSVAVKATPDRSDLHQNNENICFERLSVSESVTFTVDQLEKKAKATLFKKGESIYNNPTGAGILSC